MFLAIFNVWKTFFVVLSLYKFLKFLIFEENTGRFLADEGGLEQNLFSKSIKTLKFNQIFIFLSNNLSKSCSKIKIWFF